MFIIEKYNFMKVHILSLVVVGMGRHSGDYFYRKSTIGTIIAAIEANNDRYCLQNRIEKFPLYCFSKQEDPGK